MENFREIDYKSIKKGSFYRGKALVNLSEEDIDLLVNKCHIRTVVDLRAPEEIEKAKDQKLKGVKNISVPLFNSNKTEMKSVNVMGMDLPDMAAIYRELVYEDKKEAWSQIFDLLLENKGDGIMFHCTSGKDRTGVTTAIILSLLGIDKETIYEDYLLTNQNMYNDNGFMQFVKTLPKEVGKAFLDHFSAKKEYLDAVFDEIDSRYGSLDNFYEQCCGLDKDKIVVLKNKYLE